MKVVFFGDSFTEGDIDSGYSFADFVDMPSKESTTTYVSGIGGTTIGEYSIYPVDGYSLLERLKSDNSWRDADYIFLEFGINDVSAILAGFVSEKVVLVSFVKALDFIKQINPKAEIIFLSLSYMDSIIRETALLQCHYLKEDYFKGFDFDIPQTLWYNNYKTLVNKISTICRVIPMIDYDCFYDEYLSYDNLHPNVGGYKVIGKTISKYL